MQLMPLVLSIDILFPNKIEWNHNFTYRLESRLFHIDVASYDPTLFI